MPKSRKRLRPKSLGSEGGTWVQTERFPFMRSMSADFLFTIFQFQFSSFYQFFAFPRHFVRAPPSPFSSAPI